MTKKVAEISSNPRFLIIQTAFIGDTILATSLLEKLHATVPGARIDLFIRKGNEGLFKDHPFINTLYIWNKNRGKKYRHLWSLTAAIRKVKYHFCINLQRHSTTGLLTLFSRAKTTIGFTMNPFSPLFTFRFIHRIDATRGLTHETDLYMQLLSPVHTNTTRCMPRLYPTDSDYKAISMHQHYITIAPTSVWFTKQWPVEKWIAFIKKLNNKYTVILIGAAGDYNHCEIIKSGVSPLELINLAGALTLLQSAALMKNAVMNYANDSSPVHLASSVCAPITAIFCSTVSTFGYGPLGINGKIIETKQLLPCRPCGPHGHKSCPEGHFLCSEIDIDAIPVP